MRSGTTQRQIAHRYAEKNGLDYATALQIVDETTVKTTATGLFAQVLLFGEPVANGATADMGTWLNDAGRPDLIPLARSACKQEIEEWKRIKREVTAGEFRALTALANNAWPHGSAYANRILKFAADRGYRLHRNQDEIDWLVGEGVIQDRTKHPVLFEYMRDETWRPWGLLEQAYPLSVPECVRANAAEAPYGHGTIVIWRELVPSR